MEIRWEQPQTLLIRKWYSSHWISAERIGTLAVLQSWCNESRGDLNSRCLVCFSLTLWGVQWDRRAQGIVAWLQQKNQHWTSPKKQFLFVPPPPTRKQQTDHFQFWTPIAWSAFTSKFTYEYAEWTWKDNDWRDVEHLLGHGEKAWILLQSTTLIACCEMRCIVNELSTQATRSYLEALTWPRPFHLSDD
jgi:hypothetical protein